MKKQLLKKLSACLQLGMAFIVTAMMFSVSANAQIVYSDVNPDTSMICLNYPCYESYNLDLNNDGIVDFTLHTSHYHCQNSFYMSDTKSVSIVSQSGNLACAARLPVNVSIGSNLSFSTNSVTLRSVVSGSPGPGCPGVLGSSGSWTDSTDYYLGLRFSEGANTYFGWVRLNVIVYNVMSTVSCTVKDYAYNSIPNQPILAGQTITTGIIENSFVSSINLFPNPATNHLTISLGSNNQKVEVTIADITGKIIYRTTTDSPDSPDSYRDREQKIEVNTEDFAKGIYVVQIQTADFTGMKKLVVEK